MKKRLSYLLVASMFLFTSVLISCGDSESSEDTDSTVTENTEEISEETNNEVVADFSAGEAIYSGKGMCQTCHMANGEGIEGTFPPLSDSDYLSNIDKSSFIKMVMKGTDEPITVNGTEYPGGIMGATMSTVTLTDQEITDVVNFVLNKWGNKETVSVEDVSSVKESL